MKALKVKADDSWLDSVDVNAIPVQVISREDEGAWEFPNLPTARKQFPELDPYQSTGKFTSAMSGEVNDASALRFETWATYDVFSS